MITLCFSNFVVEKFWQLYIKNNQSGVNETLYDIGCDTGLKLSKKIT